MCKNDTAVIYYYLLLFIFFYYYVISIYISFFIYTNYYMTIKQYRGKNEKY